MTAAPPAVRVARARLANARPGDRQRLASAFDLASPAATGVAERALLLIPRMRVDRSLAEGVEGFANELIDRIRAAKVAAWRGGPEMRSGPCFFEDEVAIEIAIVRAWLVGERLPEGLRRLAPLADIPVMRWRRHVFADHRSLPRIVAALAEAGLASAWLAAFTAGELIAAADNLARAFGGALPGSAAPGLAGAKAAPLRSGPPPERTADRPAAIVGTIRIACALAPEPSARIFLAVALLAARQPALVATQVFTAALAELSSVAAAPRGGRAAPAGRRRNRMPAGVAKGSLRPAVGKSGSPVAGRTRFGPPQIRSVPAAVRPAGPLPQSVEPSRAETARPRRMVEKAPPAAPEAMAIVSERAGLLFLLNVFLALGLYGDFTDPVRRVRGLSPFALLLLLGRHWLGPGIEADPIAPLLRSLAGLGPRERPGRHFEAPAWRTPRDWLAPWPRGRPRAFAGRFGASRWHAGGFPIVDRWRVLRSAAWLRRRWVACLARYVEARLMRALDMADRGEAVATVLARRGVIQVDAERVAVAFALDSHPLSLRLAGLDRDPGWIPAAGRSIGFSFA